MKVLGLMSFYDEPVELLLASIGAMGQSGVDHMICLDGRYAMFPAAKDVSDPVTHQAIQLACQELGMACTLHVPNHPWAGNEVQKRTALFALAWTLADDGDWFWVQDADQVITNIPSDWKEQLAATEHHAAEVCMHDPVAAEANRDDWPPDFNIRSMFRAQEITVETNHCTYVTGDGRVLWGQVKTGGHKGRQQEPALWENPAGHVGQSMSPIRVEHHTQKRPPERLAAKLAYYAERDASGVERGSCECGLPATKLVARHWRRSVLGVVVADWHEACQVHAVKWEYEGYWELKRLGADPDSVQNRNGQVPAAV